MALQHRVEDGQLPQSVNELRVLRSNVGCSQGGVKTAEDLLERVVVTFAVPAGKIHVTARSRLEQRWIFQKDLIAGIAMADPHFVGTLLVPGD